MSDRTANEQALHAFHESLATLMAEALRTLDEEPGQDGHSRCAPSRADERSAFEAHVQRRDAELNAIIESVRCVRTVEHLTSDATMTTFGVRVTVVKNVRGKQHTHDYIDTTSRRTLFDGTVLPGSFEQRKAAATHRYFDRINEEAFDVTEKAILAQVFNDPAAGPLNEPYPNLEDCADVFFFAALRSREREVAHDAAARFESQRGALLAMLTTADGRPRWAM